MDPVLHYLSLVRRIRRLRPRPRPRIPSGGEWSRDAVVYNMFVRCTAAFDHNGNGRLETGVRSDGFRETGTFLKAIAMLPYVRWLGADTVHLLPITAIGRDGNKGTLGSPYAIRNPYLLDENLAEPALGLGVETEFKAFMEAAHRLGLRVVVEFVFRTAAKDADWVAEHPEWFYWIRADVSDRGGHGADETRYGSPLFTPEELGSIHRMVGEHAFNALIPPHEIYRSMFTDPPPASSIRKRGDSWVGTLPGGTLVKIPGAFADWPPDDHQPPWGDVTYLRLYDMPGFNYIAYNTIRMYDSRLAQPRNENRPLWDRIAGIIPHYQKAFGIDGVMIDMGHALPMPLKAEIVRAARSVDGDFAFWDENFSIQRKSREEGYNAVFGFLWADQHHPPRVRSLWRRMGEEGFPIPFFATPENHNTPRAASRGGGLVYARWAWLVNNFIPAIPFLHSGFELGETHPINTGLDFTPDQLRSLPSAGLPLFSEHAFRWTRRQAFPAWVRKVSALRTAYRGLITDSAPGRFRLLHDPNERILAFARVPEGAGPCLAVVTNMNWEGKEAAATRLETSKKAVRDLLTGRSLAVQGGWLRSELPPGGSIVFEFSA